MGEKPAGLPSSRYATSFNAEAHSGKPRGLLLADFLGYTFTIRNSTVPTFPINLILVKMYNKELLFMIITNMIFTVAGLILSGLTLYFVVRGIRQQRINHVVEIYLNNSRAAKTSGLHGLYIAGVLTLKSHCAVMGAVNRIVDHGEKSSLPKKIKLLDLHQFFNEVNHDTINLINPGEAEKLATKLWG